jgi:hypothetical protein
LAFTQAGADRFLEQLKCIESPGLSFHLALGELSLPPRARKRFSDAFAAGILNLTLKPRDIPIEFGQFYTAILDLFLKPAVTILKTFKFSCLWSYGSLRAQCRGRLLVRRFCMVNSCRDVREACSTLTIRAYR